MSLLKKFGLIEEIPTEDYDLSIGTGNYEMEEIDANVEGVTNENLVSDIYQANNLEDLSKSIFKVGELINSLPKEMATDTKRVSVLAILSSFNLTTDEVIDDGNSRIALLNAAMQEIVDVNTNKINASNATIEDLKKQIEDLQKIVSDLIINNKTCKDKIEQEIYKINNLIKFVEGNEGAK